MRLTLSAVVGTAACGQQAPSAPSLNEGAEGVAGQGGTTVGGSVDDYLRLYGLAITCTDVEQMTGLQMETPKQYEAPLCAKEQREVDFSDPSKINTITIIYLPSGRAEDARRLAAGDAVSRHGDEIVLELFEGFRDSRLVNPEGNLRRGPKSGRYTTSIDGVTALVYWLANDRRTSTRILWEPSTRGLWSLALETDKERESAVSIAEDLFR